MSVKEMSVIAGEGGVGKVNLTNEKILILVFRSIRGFRYFRVICFVRRFFVSSWGYIRIRLS